MLPTLEPGDRFSETNSHTWRRERPGFRVAATSVAFESSAVALPLSVDAPAVLVKRAIGLPGDHIKMTGGGQPVINGWPVPYCDAGEYVFLQAASEGRGGPFHGRLRVEFIDDRAYLTVNALRDAFSATRTTSSRERCSFWATTAATASTRAPGTADTAGALLLAAVDARAQRFLDRVAQRNGDADFWRRLRDSVVDRLQTGAFDSRA